MTRLPCVKPIPTRGDEVCNRALLGTDAWSRRTLLPCAFHVAILLASSGHKRE